MTQTLIDGSGMQAKVCDWIAENAKVPRPNLDTGADLLATGVLDSVGFLNLVMFLEGEFETEIDFDQLDEDGDMTSVRGLLNYFEQN